MIQETPLRHELKLVVEPHQLAQARSWIRLHPAGFQTAYPPRLINNLYLDTANLNSFNANLLGISTRQKLRLRWYGEAWPQAVNPTLELKCKSNLLGNKKIEQLDCVLNWQRPFNDLLATIRSHADKQWTAWLNSATSAALINQYHREYYVSADGNLRATLDYQQIAYDQRMSQCPNLQRQLPLADLVVIEIKSAPQHGEALQRAMAYFPLPRSRNSKYVNGLMASWL